MNFLMKNKVIIIIVILALVIVVIPFGQSNEIKSSFGNWKVEVYGNTADGEQIEFEVERSALQLFSFYYQGSEVVSITYKLKAIAIGSGFTSCEIDTTGIRSAGSLWKTPGGPGGWVHNWYNEYGENTVTVPLNDQYVEILSRTFEFPNDDDGNGDYIIEIKWRGSASFRGVSSNGNGEWASEEIDLNSMFDLTVDDSGGGGNPPPPPPEEYTITVLTNPTSDWITCTLPPGVQGSPEMKTGNPVYFTRIPGNYTIQARFDDIGSGVTRTKSVTVVNSGKTVVINGYSSLSITSLSYTVKATVSTVPYVSSNGYTLG